MTKAKGREVNVMLKTEKRAELYKEWRLAIYANDGNYYTRTLWTGIPDGDDEVTVLSDLQDGFYDEELEEMINLYDRAKSKYGEAGWYIGDDVHYGEADAIKAIEKLEGKLPKRIYKNKIEY